MPFEEFDRRAATASKSPFVTIQRRGPFSLNRAAVELMGNPEAVVLLYDKEEKLIGFRPAPLTNPRALPVRSQGKNASTFMVAGQAFAQHYDLDTSVARRYAVEMQGDLLVLDLKAESVDVTGPRASSKSRHATI